MSVSPDRKRRPRGSATTINTKIIGGRVPPEVHARAHRGAAARNMTLAVYLQMLVEQDELAGAPPPEAPAQLDYTDAIAS